MSNGIEFSPEAKGIAMDAALASNTAYNQTRSLETQLERLAELGRMNLHGVNIEPTATEELVDRINQSQRNYKTLLTMAGLVSEFTDPYNMPLDKELPADHRFVTWLMDEEDRHVPVITEDAFVSVYKFLNPGKRPSSATIAHRCITRSVPSRTRNDEETGSLGELIFRDEHLLNVPVGTSYRTYIRAYMIQDIAVAATEHQGSIDKLGDTSLGALQQIAMFYSRHAETLIQPSEPIS